MFIFNSYFQRSGRTGRAEDEGAVITLLAQKDRGERQEEMVSTLKKMNCKIE
jgi:ATP-dependent RNA helicase DDX19/DBP5